MLFSKCKGSASEHTEGETSGKLRMLLILGIALLGVILLLYGGGIVGKTDTQNTEKNDALTSEATIKAFRAELEERIRTLCQSVEGVGSVRIFVSLEGGYSAVYATEDGSNGEEYVILGSGSSASPILLRTEMPEIRGIGIVCSGGNSPNVRREIISLLSAALHVASNRIYVTAGA